MWEQMVIKLVVITLLVKYIKVESLYCKPETDVILYVKLYF